MMKEPILLAMKNSENEIVSHQLNHQIKVLDPTFPLIGKTTDTLPFLEFGKGTDRLGGAKINYIDTAILLHITGKSENRYRVKLASGYTAYIPQRSEEHTSELQSRGHLVCRLLLEKK